ncbi:endonuclease III [bacterium]|nr:MAG: endonuclease III [bacterium]
MAGLESESSEGAVFLMTSLEAVYGEAVNIPRFEPLEELVSCIMSQHGSDVFTYPAFTRLRETFPDWADVMAAGPERVAEVIRDAGLANQKARSILSVLGAIHARFGAYTLDPIYGMETDEAYDWLLSLPGVGPKTSSLVLSFSFGRHRVPVDTHVGRVAARWGLIPPKTNDAKAHLLLNALCPPGTAYRFHAALIQHGRLTCGAKKPDCPRCAVRTTCRYFREGEYVS